MQKDNEENVESQRPQRKRCSGVSDAGETTWNTRPKLCPAFRDTEAVETSANAMLAGGEGRGQRNEWELRRWRQSGTTMRVRTAFFSKHRLFGEGRQFQPESTGFFDMK